MAGWEEYARLQADVDTLVRRAEGVTTGNEEAMKRINAQLDLCFTRCQALMDDVNRFDDPLLYVRLLATYRTLCALFQRVG
jgi:hypothetical protein